MSKEIWKEYLDEALYGRKTKEEYLYFGKTLDKQDCWLNGVFVPKNFEEFTRKPKTQMINGHEVVAPKYGRPDDSLDCVFEFYPQSKNGYIKIYRIDARFNKSFEFGYFEEEKDATAYANAHRENKNE